MNKNAEVVLVAVKTKISLSYVALTLLVKVKGAAGEGFVPPPKSMNMGHGKLHYNFHRLLVFLAFTMFRSFFV